ncbi:MAG TPA: PIG-L family deacetylase [Phycisphaerae bacterium]|nr:PIG-L family deacetylase [Phycisphaerae bacterium]
MKPTPTSPNNAALLAFGAHPDDIEFGCGGVIAIETQCGRKAHMVVCSRGEAGSSGTPEQRVQEAKTGAEILGATLEFAELDGDARLEIRTAHAIALAAIIRRVKPGIVLAPSPSPNQHPDHSRLGQLVRDAARLARYGNLDELRAQPPHAIDALLFYEVTSDSAESGQSPLLVDVSDPAVMTAWTRSMEAHASQLRTRNYVELRLTRARLNGLRGGVGHAIALHPNDPLIVESLSQVCRGARAF